MGAAASVGQAQSQPQSMPMGTASPMGMGQMGGMDHGMNKPMVPAGPLKIAFGDKSAQWTPATLAALPHTTLTVYNVHIKANQTFSGVPLIELLAPLGVPAKPHGKEFQFYLVAEGSDGYKVVFSVAEVTPDVHDSTVIVADALDGKPLASSGPLQLVATGEKRPARWVRNLVAVRVLTAE
jgi:hypothetical protein